MNQPTAPSPSMSRREEFDAKLLRLRQAMEREGVDAALLTLQASHAWLGCGADTHIVMAGVDGACALLVTHDDIFMIADNIEQHRLLDEEFDGLPLTPEVYPWHEGGRARLIGEKVGRGRLGVDAPHAADVTDLSAALAACRASLLPPEVDRYKVLGHDTELALRDACHAIHPGMSEHEIAAELAGRVVGLNLLPNLILVAVDDRIGRYRHPIPKETKLKQTAMLVVCARRHGLIANVTRMVHFGELPDDLRRRHDAVCAVDAELIMSTRVGASYGEILQKGLAIYAEMGFADEWMLHHQGGPTGYAGREFKALPHTQARVEPFQPVAWNPSITGTKSEDTILATPEGPLVLTQAHNWPMLTLEHDSGPCARPDLLIFE